jgi:hypothetical protein
MVLKSITVRNYFRAFPDTQDKVEPISNTEAYYEISLLRQNKTPIARGDFRTRLLLVENSKHTFQH